MHSLAHPQANPIVTEHLAKVIPHLKADSNTPLPELPATIIDGSLPNFAYPMTQLQKTIMNIDDEISVIHSHLPPTLSPSGLSS